MLWFLCDSNCVKLICLVDDYGNLFIIIFFFFLREIFAYVTVF